MEKKYPTNEGLNFIVCDDIREEQNNKLILVGVYGGGDILFEPKGSDDVVYNLPSLALFFQFLDGFGEFNGSFELVDPSGNHVINHADTGVLTKKDTGALVFYAKVNNFNVKEFGQYKAVMRLDDEEYEKVFQIKCGES